MEQNEVFRFGGVWVVVALVNAASLIIVYFVLSSGHMDGEWGKQDIDLALYRAFRIQDFVVYLGLSSAIVVICYSLTKALKSHQNVVYMQCRQRIMAQSLGMLLFSAINLTSELTFVNNLLTAAEYWEHSYLEDPINFALFLGP